MSEKLQERRGGSLEGRIQQFAQYLLVLRKIQDKTGAEFLASLGNLSMQELNVLNTIGEIEPCVMGEIAKQTALSTSSVTVIVDKLVKAKLVQRVRDEGDRRVVYGSLTPEGKKIYQRQIEHVHQVIRQLFSLLTVEEQASLLSIFHKLTRSSL